MEPTGFTETSVNDYLLMLRHMPQELHCGGSLKSRKHIYINHSNILNSYLPLQYLNNKGSVDNEGNRISRGEW
jgi:hypothetical protein